MRRASTLKNVFFHAVDGEPDCWGPEAEAPVASGCAAQSFLSSSTPFCFSPSPASFLLYTTPALIPVPPPIPPPSFSPQPFTLSSLVFPLSLLVSSPYSRTRAPISVKCTPSSPPYGLGCFAAFWPLKKCVIIGYQYRSSEERPFCFLQRVSETGEVRAFSRPSSKLMTFAAREIVPQVTALLSSPLGSPARSTHRRQPRN